MPWSMRSSMPKRRLAETVKRTPLPPRKKPLPRSTKPIAKVSPRRRQRSGRVGKMGIVRLYGKALKALRRECFIRDDFKCVDCHCTVAWDEHEARDLGLRVGEMSHVKGKRNHGDTLDNVVTRCREDHQKSHNCGGKPLPRK